MKCLLCPPPSYLLHISHKHIPSPVTFPQVSTHELGHEPGKSNTPYTHLFKLNFQVFSHVLYEAPALSRPGPHFVFSAADAFHFLLHTHAGSYVAHSEV